MKKILVILAAAIISLGAATTADAQKLSDKFCTVGLHTGAYTGDFGLGVNLDFYAGNWRGRLLLDGGNFFNNSKDVWFVPAVDFHYVINVIGGLNVYPVVGVNSLIASHISNGVNTNVNIGVDLGAGIEYCFTDRFSLFAEGKYQRLLFGTEGINRNNGIFGFAYAL